MRLATVLVILLLAGCASGATSDPSASPSGSGQPLPAQLLPGEQWVLMNTPAAGFSVTMEFDDGKVAGKAPINRVFGPVAIDGESMTLGPLAATQMAGEPAAMAAETGYLQALAQVDSWSVSYGVLTLSGGGKPLLKYAAPDTTGAFAVTLIGKKRGVAKAAAVAAGYQWRVVSVDGESLIVTADYLPNRIDATIVDGVVTEVGVG